jgi:hypothetical protein
MAPRKHEDEGDFTDPLLGEELGEDDGGAGGREGRAGFVPEFVRKVAVAGLGALFMTEDGIRSLAGQLKLPKEVLGLVLSQAEKTKDDIGRVVSEELRRFLQSEKLRDEFLKLMSGMTVEVTAQIRLVKPEEGQKKTAAPAAKLTVSELKAGRGRKAKKA